MSDEHEFLFAWEIKYKCPKCSAPMQYKPERGPKGAGGYCVVNWYECTKCDFRTTGVFDLVKE